MIIGCVSLVFYHDHRIVAMQCKKGRGIILPGGKWEKGETFRETAARELKEEVGLTATSQNWIYGGMSSDGAFVNTFVTKVEHFHMKETAEGIPMFTDWEGLLTSDFKAYYDILGEIMKWKYHA